MKRVSLLSSLTLIKIITTLTVIVMLASCKREVPDTMSAPAYFPEGSKTGLVGSGNYTLYGNIEGVSFIDDSTIVTCSDKASGSKTSYQTYKDQSVQIFRINIENI